MIALNFLPCHRSKSIASHIKATETLIKAIKAITPTEAPIECGTEAGTEAPIEEEARIEGKHKIGQDQVKEES